MESSRPIEKRKTKEDTSSRNGDRHERNEQQLDRTRKEGPGQSGINDNDNDDNDDDNDDNDDDDDDDDDDEDGDKYDVNIDNDEKEKEPNDNNKLIVGFMGQLKLDHHEKPGSTE
ncbi:unnamed protein product [Schistosoma margrebowiei]|uniref:Uncharacterized protein n=1 Tax=Schistosoma margrebowiei TaxID=48269 RepID=A0A183LGK6_9TREM|nr:unnamed protein product [Schistosoma margrebowiei]